jgi:hypothetical protein
MVKKVQKPFCFALAVLAPGIDVKYMGKPLTDFIRQGWHTLTF